jgi:hypothetical protein
MIRPIDIKLNAAHPELPLVEATTFTGAPSSVFIRGVPKSVGNWSITAVNVAVTYPDNSTTTRAAVESAEGVWVATIPGTATSGRTTAGFRILADGIDENGAAVTGYVLGFADFSVFSFLPVPAPGETYYLLRYFDTMPTTPKKGDVAVVSGVLKYYNGTTWLPFADLTNYYTKEAVDDLLAGKASKSDVDPLLFAQYYPEGNVKSTVEFTPGIKYDDPDTVNRTITVKPFCKTRTAENDNSVLVGRVVIPPFVDASGNPYITDDGTRFRVVGVSGSDDRIFANTNPTAIVAPNTVTTIGGSAFIYCTALSSVSLPAATTVGDYAFTRCAVLASVDFGDTPRPDVPSLGVSAFNNVPATCKIIVPYTQYDEWKAADGWSALQQEFVRHAEKADKPATFTTGNLAKFDANGNPVDSGNKPSDFQSALSAQQLANIAAVSDAPAFDATHSYAAGDPVVYNGTLYTFTATHTGAWTGSDVSAVDIIARLALKANDNAVVKLTGDQTIGGNKGFTGHDNFYNLTISHPQGQGYVRIYALANENRVHIEFSDAVSGSQGELFLPVLGGYGAVTLAAIENLAPDAFIMLYDGATVDLNTLYCYQGRLYRCILGYTFQSGDSYPPDDITHWTLATVEDVLAALRTAIAGKADVSAIPYILVTKTISNNAVTLDDRASNAVTISATLSPNTLTINFPTAATSGKVRDFAMRLNIAAGVTAPEIAWPQGVTLENNGGEVPEIADGGTGGSSTILYFSETENNGTTAKFLVKGETLTAIAQA